MKKLLLSIGLFSAFTTNVYALTEAEADITENNSVANQAKTISTKVTITASSSISTSAETLSLLHQMSVASKSLSYEMSYVLIRKNSIEPLMYRYALDGDFPIARSLYLTGHLREVIRLDDVISYIEPGIEPFSIRSNNMVAPIIPVLNANIRHLSSMYDFISIGRAREAGKACQVVRIVPKDGLRYSYAIWIDEGTKLPLRADLVDRDGQVLEQFRTISYVVDDNILTSMKLLKKAKLPEVLNLPSKKDQQTDWKVGWVPQGFIDSGVNRYRIPMSDVVVENRLFSDGLFDFSVYVAEKDSKQVKAEAYRQGRRVLHTVVRGSKEISVVGDIPPITAKRIIDSVTFSPNNNS